VKSVTSCPKCGSKKIKWFNPEAGIWKCENCGYQGSFVLESSKTNKQLKESKKMEKLQKKLLRGRF